MFDLIHARAGSNAFTAVGTLGGGVARTGAIVAQVRARDNPLAS